jgi:periplasmic divalent cation tolerance protein
MNDTISVIQTTLPGEWLEAEVGQWAFSIINDNLAACAQRNRVESTFNWEGKVEYGSEWRIQLKTSVEKSQELIARINDSHPYDSPQILWWEANSTAEYLNWVQG